MNACSRLWYPHHLAVSGGRLSCFIQNIDTLLRGDTIRVAENTLIFC